MLRALSVALALSCLTHSAVAVPLHEDRESAALQDQLRESERGTSETNQGSEKLAAARVEGEQGEATEAFTSPKRELQLETQVHSDSLLSREDRRKIGLAAGQLLMHVHKARRLLERDDVGAAQQQIDKAIVLSHIIEKNAPVFSVSTKIKTGDLEYNDESTVSSALVPVYSELTQAVVLGPIVVARRSEDISDLKSRTKEYETRGVSSAVPEDARALASCGYLDITRAQADLLEAMEQTKRENSQRARAALVAIQHGVLLSYSAADMPVIQARDNLAIARVLARQGQIDDARRALSASAGALDKYERQSGQEQLSDVAAVRKEILALAESVQEGDPSLAARIDEWSHQMTEWIQLG